MILDESEENVTWSIGYYLGENDDGTYSIEHLLRVKKNNGLYWTPLVDEISTNNVQLSDIFPITPTGDWEVNKSGTVQFKLKNGAKIRQLFKKYIEG